MKTVWEFKTARISVALQIDQDINYVYDGDDEDGETQSKLNSGEYVAFDSRVVVYLDGSEIGSDSLGGSVYDTNNVDEFWTAHRTSPAEYRNTLAQKAQNRVICHYFPDMVAQACKSARAHLRDLKGFQIREENN